MVNRSASVACGDTFCGNTIVIITRIYWHDYLLTRFFVNTKVVSKTRSHQVAGFKRRLSCQTTSVFNKTY